MLYIPYSQNIRLSGILARYEATSNRLDKIRTAILQNGPLTLYNISNKCSLPLGSAHRLVKSLEEQNELQVYREESYKSGMNKKFYGFSISGLLWAIKADSDGFNRRFDEIAEIWCKEDKFPLSREIKDRIGEKKVRKAAQKMLWLMAKALDIGELFAEMDLGEKLALGSFIGIYKYKSLIPHLRTLYEEIPSFRRVFDIQYGLLMSPYLAVAHPEETRKQVEKFVNLYTNYPEFKGRYDEVMGEYASAVSRLRF